MAFQTKRKIESCNIQLQVSIQRQLQKLMMSPVIHSAHAVLVKNTNGATEIRAELVDEFGAVLRGTGQHEKVDPGGHEAGADEFEHADELAEHEDLVALVAEFFEAFEQGVDPGAGRAQARFERVALLGQGLHLLAEQGVGALQFLVAQQQTLNALGDLIEDGVVRHGQSF